MPEAYKNLKFPFRKGRVGFFSPVSGKEAIRQNVKAILVTKLGERPHEPEFGSRLWELVFEQSDMVLETLARQFIIDAIARWEPRIQIVEVLVSFDNNANEVSFSISYLIKSSANEQDTLILPARRQSGFTP